MKYKYTKESLELIAKECYSIRQILIRLNIKPCGGNYFTIKKYIKLFNIDTSHFKGKGWNKGFSLPPKRDIKEYLENKTPIHSYKLKTKLLKEKLIDRICYNCNLTTWLENPIPLELHHLDGNPMNNNLINLILLCPNCHSLTDNYRGKNKK